MGIYPVAFRVVFAKLRRTDFGKHHPLVYSPKYSTQNTDEPDVSMKRVKRKRPATHCFEKGSGCHGKGRDGIKEGQFLRKNTSRSLLAGLLPARSALPSYSLNTITCNRHRQLPLTAMNGSFALLRSSSLGAQGLRLAKLPVFSP